jgi:hypothetical protein
MIESSLKLEEESCKPFYISTAINYTNSSPHVGHAYESVLAGRIFLPNQFLFMVKLQTLTCFYYYEYV